MIDRESGKVERVVAVHDVGKAVNPQLCAGQIEGSVHMGLGYALSEDFPTDPETGFPEFSTLRQLGILRAKDVPEIEVHLVEVPQPRSPYGIKGVGEIGLVPTAPAVAAALHDLDGQWRAKLPMRRAVGSDDRPTISSRGRGTGCRTALVRARLVSRRPRSQGSIARSASAGLHEVDDPPVVAVDPRRVDDRRRHRHRAVRPDRDLDDRDRAVLGRGRPAGRSGQVRDHVAEPEHHPRAVDLLDRLEHVRVVADDEVDVAAGRDLVGDVALERGRRGLTLRAPVHADDDDVGAAQACCSCVGDDPRRLDQR